MKKNMETDKCLLCGDTGCLLEIANDKNEPVLFICPSCIEELQDILWEAIHTQHFIDASDEDIEKKELEKENKKFQDYIKTLNLKLPREIKSELDKYVIGQDRAKKVLAVSIYNHYKRIINGCTHIQKSNILLVGPTGCGKTELARTIANILDVPFCICDATTVTEAGYVGDDVENILLRLIQSADYDIKKAEIGIIYIDEIDKIARASENVSITRDVSGEGVQQALLKIIEGADVDVPLSGGRKHPMEERVTINTQNILFICGGAFENITMNSNKSLKTSGFTQSEQVEEDNTGYLGEVTTEQLRKSGLIPELIGRLQIRVKLDKLNKSELKQILDTKKNNIVDQYKDLVKLDNVELDITESAKEFITDKAYENNTGARGLKSILDQYMIDLMYDIPSLKNKISKVTIQADKGLKHKYKYKKVS